MKNPLTLAGIEPATFRFVAQHLNHCATAGATRYRSGWVRMKILLPPGYEPRTVHPVASGYTDWVIDSPPQQVLPKSNGVYEFFTTNMAEHSSVPRKMDKLMVVDTTWGTSEGWRNRVNTEDKHVSLHPNGSETLPNVFVLSSGPNGLFKDSFRLYVGVIRASLFTLKCIHCLEENVHRLYKHNQAH